MHSANCSPGPRKCRLARLARRHCCKFGILGHDSDQIAYAVTVRASSRLMIFRQAPKPPLTRFVLMRANGAFRFGGNASERRAPAPIL
jgi:hypothetical protein